MATLKQRVYDFANAADFLRAEFTHRREYDPQFSVRQWASEMGIENPSLLVLLLKGRKRIQLRHVGFLKKGLILDPSEELYFEALVLKGNSKSSDEIEVFDRLLQNLSPGASVTARIIDDAQVFEDWSTLAVLSALEINELRSEHALVNAFQGRISPDSVRRKIAFLIKNDLVVEKNGVLEPNQQRLSSSNDWSSDSVRKYYSEVTELAKTAIPLDVREREFQCFSVTISNEDLDSYKEMIRTFRTKIASRAVHTSRPDAVYQMNMQFFPVIKADPVTVSEAGVNRER